MKVPQSDQPGAHEARDHDQLRDNARLLGSDVIHCDAKHDAQECSRKNRHSHHQPLFLGIQAERLTDLDTKGTE